MITEKNVDDNKYRHNCSISVFYVINYNYKSNTKVPLILK